MFLLNQSHSDYFNPEEILFFLLKYEFTQLNVIIYYITIYDVIYVRTETIIYVLSQVGHGPVCIIILYYYYYYYCLWKQTLIILLANESFRRVLSKFIKDEIIIIYGQVL